MKSDYYVVKFWQKMEHFYFLGLKGYLKNANLIKSMAIQIGKINCLADSDSSRFQLIC